MPVGVEPGSGMAANIRETVKLATRKEHNNRLCGMGATWLCSRGVAVPGGAVACHAGSTHMKA